jgi:hypothetical protein
MSRFCRLVACPEGGSWGFYLVNDSSVVFDSVLLHSVGYEWGDMGNSEQVNVLVHRLGPGEHARLWTDDGSGAEVRMDLAIRLRIDGSDHELRFELPKLYKQRDLPVVPPLGKPGYVADPEG